ncbi:TetR family transcriptional regulator [Rhodococcus opacus PD630]|uniref:TetR/AcrR family transcriptional regulator n=1 Tax=Rhodococcus TaxID=1827 RepID=UPI00029CAD86|nr:MULTISPECIES: TetR/AcrR family transcriptional regulator [Rhodococcus]RZK71452.1 MAG: TetR/AcrR family transcriptional regulator [Rhodococcus sp. (in: high G+C Gram-positive bacteria)]AHK33610.1 HTH-type transcriptional regulator ttgR [Rhodococcus opacus PD630]EHI40458.1 TetR family transcriptional regulator [Rhodococcus opacus PD630]KXX54745.1 TetR family transcriptional regulator [Rhodococcus sp. LB1]PBC57063.1 TetR/AcrR family transcriptional regulator [Rhodococcus sp. ACPA1]
MGNREDLIDGATRSLYDKGYSRTTARDIASASGVSLAAIGYHFGTKEALLHAALYREMERWGDDLATAAGKKIEPGMSPTERFEAIWTGVIESFTAHRRLWMLQFELLGHLDSLPELRKNLVASTADARDGLVELFGDAGIEPGRAHTLGALYQALLLGVAEQWLVDPDHAMSAEELLTALRALSSHLA